jgi:hypothetical protein
MKLALPGIKFENKFQTTRKLLINLLNIKKLK